MRVVVCSLLVATALAVVPPPTPSPATAAAPAPTAAVVRCGGEVATLVGTDRDDRLVGTAGDDVIVGGRGADRIAGRGGDDVICGGRRSDLLVGGAGDDHLLGGRDEVTGSKYGPYASGDTLVPGPGDDVVEPGWDRRQARVGQTPDTLVLTRPSGVRVHLAGPGGWGRARGEGHDRVRGQRIVVVRGTAGDDHLVGGRGEDRLLGAGGSDTLEGRGGDDHLDDRDRLRTADRDVLRGGSGEDVVSSSRGADVVEGGSGDDRLTAHAGSCASLDGGAGADSGVLVALADLGYDATTGASALAGRPACGTVAGVEDVGLVARDQDISYRGTEGPDVVAASTTGVVTLDLLGGDDHATTGVGDDVVLGGPGTDTVDAGSGYDACVDTEVGLSCESPTFPVVRSCDGRAATIVADRAGGDLVGTPGDDVIVGSDAQDRIDGLGGDDVLCGRDGDDRLVGGEGDDRLFGGADGVASLDVDFWGVTGDVLLPGPGDDLVDAGYDERQQLSNAVVVPDTVSWADSPVGIVADFTTSPGTVTGPGTDTVRVGGLLRLLGTPYDDVVRGTALADHVDPGAGHDRVDGGAGDDTCPHTEERTSCSRR